MKEKREFKAQRFYGMSHKGSVVILRHLNPPPPPTHGALEEHADDPSTACPEDHGVMVFVLRTAEVPTLNSCT